MSRINLFAEENTIGTFHNFRGHGSQGLEFHADIILYYRDDFQSIPMHGQFILIQLQDSYEALLGRIVSIDSYRKKEGKKEAFNYYYEEKLMCRINMHILGVLYSQKNKKFVFVSSHRRFPRPGSAVALPSIEILREIAGHNNKGVAIGYLALGEYVYSQEYSSSQKDDWIPVLPEEVLTRFPIASLISRRSFIFARAGFGKSNLNKLLFSELYKQPPMVLSRHNKETPVGTIIFDPDGEYFWPDNKGRPGLCDVPELQNNIVVFTDREAPSDFYQSFVAGKVKLDIRELSPKDVLSVAFNSYKQEQQNIRKLKDLETREWVDLINHIEEGGNGASLEDICILLQLENKQGNEALAARANMTSIVQLLHDGNSQLMDMLSFSLARGKLCIIDISQLHDADSLVLTGLILREIFNKNQKEFTKKNPESIPTIAVIEEAQSVLNGHSSASLPHRDWIKEGRKYDLGAVLVTQQPGSIPKEILSQGDNWFVLHLLSAVDLLTLQKANAYFSRDILSMLLNEPIPGHGSFWSSVTGRPYPVPMRVLSFEDKYKMLDPNYDKPAIDTFIQILQTEFIQNHKRRKNLLDTHMDNIAEAFL